MKHAAAHVQHIDCLDGLAKLPTACCDLVYLDPPFMTGRRHIASEGSYSDSWANLDDYMAFMRPRLEHIHRVLKSTGSVLIHCDWRTCHHFRLMLDELFGREQFVNHLIWSYGLGGSSPRRFSRKHDDILFYGKTQDYYFEPPLVPATSNRLRGKLKKSTDVINIPAINNMSHERVGYPTQKPIALLELLITACSPPQGMVIDPFCGSGTTVIAALRCKRKSKGFDRNPDAIVLAEKRIQAEPYDASLEAQGAG